MEKGKFARTPRGWGPAGVRMETRKEKKTPGKKNQNKTELSTKTEAGGKTKGGSLQAVKIEKLEKARLSRRRNKKATNIHEEAEETTKKRGVQDA